MDTPTSRRCRSSSFAQELLRRLPTGLRAEYLLWRFLHPDLPLPEPLHRRIARAVQC